MAVRIGHARSDENNRAKGGKSGDQTCKEVVIQDWYNGNWEAVFRAKDNKVAEKIAQTMELVCMNDSIGYDQGQRTTLYNQAKQLKWDISKISSKCECDCSSLVSVCVNSAGISISKDMYTGNQKKVLLATGKFEILKDSKYLVESTYLKRGDILLCSGHTAIVISNDEILQKIESAKNFSASYAGTYIVTASNLNIRCGAGTTKSVLKVVPKGTALTCYGYYTKCFETTWLYVQFIYHGKLYTGFASMRYLSK